MFTMNDARARFEVRFVELQNKARWYFQHKGPEAKDEAVANSLFLTWHHFHRLVQRGKACNRTLTKTFYFSCRQTYSGRMLRAVRNSHSRELFNQVWNGGQMVVNGFDLHEYPDDRASIPDRVAFKIDTQAWLDSLTETQRRRVLELAEGNSTSECARLWNVSRPAVSIYRREMAKKFDRFMSSQPEPE